MVEGPYRAAVPYRVPLNAVNGFAQKVAHVVQRIVDVASFGASRGATRLRSSVAPRLRFSGCRATPVSRFDKTMECRMDIHVRRMAKIPD